MLNLPECAHLTDDMIECVCAHFDHLPTLLCSLLFFPNLILRFHSLLGHTNYYVVHATHSTVVSINTNIPKRTHCTQQQLL